MKNAQALPYRVTPISLALALLAVAGARFGGGVLAAASALSPANPGAIMRAIMRAYRQGRRQIVIPPGVYRLPRPQGNFYMKFSNMSNFRIIGSGVTLLRTDPAKGGILFSDCRNMAFKGFTLRCDPLPYTEGRVIALKNYGVPTRVVRICRGYRTDVANFSSVTIFSAERRRIWPGMTPFAARAVQRLGKRTFRLTNCGVPCRVGDWIVFRSQGASDIQLNSCRGMSISHVIVLGGTGYCFGETGGEGEDRYSSDSVLYPPYPRGAVSSPILASCADGFHSNSVRRGPVLVGCHFEATGDDAIAIQGWYAVLRRAAGRHWVVQFPQSLGSDFCRKGDLLRVDDSHGTYLGTTHVIGKQRVPDYKPRRQILCPSGVAFVNSKVYAVTVGSSVPGLSPGDRINDTNVDGAGFVVRDCVVTRGYSRGMIIKADNGLVSDNVVDACANGDIELLPELPWDESGSSSNLLIVGNTIRDTGPTYPDQPTWNEAGAMSVLTNTSARATSFNHANILITGNRFVCNNGINLLVSGARNMLVADNVFIKPMRQPSRRGASLQFGTSSLVWLQQCQDVLLAGNRVIHPGAAMKKLVGVGPDVNNVMGIKNGVGMTRFKQAKKGS